MTAHYFLKTNYRQQTAARPESERFVFLVHEHHRVCLMLLSSYHTIRFYKNRPTACASVSNSIECNDAISITCIINRMAQWQAVKQIHAPTICQQMPQYLFQLEMCFFSPCLITSHFCMRKGRTHMPYHAWNCTWFILFKIFVTF